MRRAPRLPKCQAIDPISWRTHSVGWLSVRSAGRAVPFISFAIVAHRRPQSNKAAGGRLASSAARSESVGAGAVHGLLELVDGVLADARAHVGVKRHERLLPARLLLGRELDELRLAGLLHVVQSIVVLLLG